MFALPFPLQNSFRSPWLVLLPTSLESSPSLSVPHRPGVPRAGWSSWWLIVYYHDYIYIGTIYTTIFYGFGLEFSFQKNLQQKWSWSVSNVQVRLRFLAPQILETRISFCSPRHFGKLRCLLRWPDTPQNSWDAFKSQPSTYVNISTTCSLKPT